MARTKQTARKTTSNKVPRTHQQGIKTLRLPQKPNIIKKRRFKPGTVALR